MEIRCITAPDCSLSNGTLVINRSRRSTPVTCSRCGRHGEGQQLPRGWTSVAQVVLCNTCCRQHYRRRSFTLKLNESCVGNWPEFDSVVEQALGRGGEMLVHRRCWHFTVTRGRFVVRLRIGGKWSALRLESSRWPHGRRTDFRRIAAGHAIVGDLRIVRKRAPGCLAADQHEPMDIVCKTVAWLPRPSVLKRQRVKAKQRPGNDPSSKA